MTIYARLGDPDDYHEFGSCGELADHLRASGVGVATLERHGDYGLECDGYRGQNYISAYYGDDVETPAASLSDAEIEAIRGSDDDASPDYSAPPTAEANEAAAPTAGEFDVFVQSYLAAALWSSTGDDDAPLDDSHGTDDFDGDSLESLRMECYEFATKNAADIRFWSKDGDDDVWGNAGHDFWLTRCGHGCGFWDGDWDKCVGDRLTAASKAAGERDIVVGDDGQLHHEGG
jgi:hypothetical protein